MTTPYTPASASELKSNQPRRFGAKPEPPRISPRTESHATILVHGVNDVGAKVYRLFFEARNGAPQTWVVFRNDDVAVQAVFEREFPNGLQGPEYKALIDWRVKWHTVGGKPVADEIDVTPRNEGEMTDQPASEPTPADELTAALQRSAITVDTKTSARFFAQVGAIADEFKLPATNRNEYYHQCLGVDSFDNWQGTFDDAIDQLRLAIIDNVYAPYDAVRNYLSSLFIAAGRKATRDTYLAATGDDGLKDSLEKQRKPSELVKAIRAWLQKPAETPNATATKSEPQNGQNSSAGNIPPEPPANAVAGKIEPQTMPANGNGQIPRLPAPSAIPEIIVPDSATSIILFDPNKAVARTKMYSDTIRALRADNLLREGKDFGKIPGAGDKPTLYKAGAEKLCNVFGFCPRFILVDKVVNWSPAGPMFYFQYECQLVSIETGKVVATGIGSCNSMESKYRYRWLWKNQLDDLGMKPDGLATRKTKNGSTQYRVENDDIFSQVNTLDKMAQKRALVAATLIGANASEHFTQDVEDLPDFGYIDAEIA